jgi:hypothetical protein
MCHTPESRSAAKAASRAAALVIRSRDTLDVRRRQEGVTLLLLGHGKVRLRLGVQLLLRTGKVSPWDSAPLRWPAPACWGVRSFL